MLNWNSYDFHPKTLLRLAEEIRFFYAGLGLYCIIFLQRKDLQIECFIVSNPLCKKLGRTFQNFKKLWNTKVEKLERVFFWKSIECLEYP